MDDMDSSNSTKHPTTSSNEKNASGTHDGVEFSARNIRGGTVAGQKQEYFTKVEQPKEAKPRRQRQGPGIGKRIGTTIINFWRKHVNIVLLVLILAVAGVTIFLVVQQLQPVDTTLRDEDGDIITESYSTDDEVAYANAKVDYENRIDAETNQQQKYNLQLEYADFLVENDQPMVAIAELQSIPENSMDDTQKYYVYSYLERLYREYMEDEVNAQIYADKIQSEGLAQYVTEG